MIPQTKEASSVTHAALWERFSQTGSDECREQLFLRYHAWALSVCRQTPLTVRGGVVDRDDLENGVCEELLKCIGRYDHTRGVPFEGFAYRRIRGAVLNQIGGEVKHLSGRLNGSQGITQTRSSSLRDAVLEIELLAVEVLVEEFGYRQTSGQENTLFKGSELVALMQRAMDTLTKREHQVVTQHFFEDRDKSEVARALEISRGRVSQLLAAAMTKLRKALVCKDIDDFTEW